MDREKWMQFKEKYLKKDQLLILVLIGVLLLVISLPVGEKPNTAKEQDINPGKMDFVGMSEGEKVYQEGTTPGNAGEVRMDYEKEMEKRLLELLEVMEGV